MNLPGIVMVIGKIQSNSNSNRLHFNVFSNNKVNVSTVLLFTVQYVVNDNCEPLNDFHNYLNLITFHLIFSNNKVSVSA